MNLTDHSANSRAIAANNNEKVFSNESYFPIHIHNFNVSKSLAVRTNLILALYNKNTTSLQGSIRLAASVPVQIEDRFVIFANRLVAAPVVPIMLLKRRVRTGVGGATGCVHIGRIKYNAIQFAVFVGQLATINAILNVGGLQFVSSGRYIPPEHSLPIGNICHNTTRANKKFKNVWKYVVVALKRCAEDKFGRRLAIANHTLLLRMWPSIAA